MTSAIFIKERTELGLQVGQHASVQMAFAFFCCCCGCEDRKDGRMEGRKDTQSLLLHVVCTVLPLHFEANSSFERNRLT